MKKNLQLLFPAITYLLGIITFIISLFVYDKIDVVDTITCFLVPCLPFVFPLAQRFWKKEPPLILNILICIEIILSIYGGAVFNFYQVLSCYDLILHCYFGLICSMVLYYILLQFHAGILNKGILLFMILLSTLGVGALWEIWEYACDSIGGGDAQRVQEALAMGISPVADTMEDLMITAVGVFLFYILIYVDKALNHRLLKSLDLKEE